MDGFSKPLAAVAAAALLAALPGCALLREKPVSQVGDSQLNWVTVRYHPADRSRKPCYLNVIGVGSVEFREGRSPLVFNSFSQDVDNPLWGDIDEEKLGVTPEQARYIMQLFVDAGLTREPGRMKRLPEAERSKAEGGVALFTAKLNNQPLRVTTNNPRLLDAVETVIGSITSSRGFR